MERTGRRVIIISLLVLAGILLAFGVAVLPLGPIGYKHACQWWEERRRSTDNEWWGKRLAHLRKMEQPKLSGKEVAALLKEQKGIYTQELYDMADWYVYHGNADVIRQVLTNRQFEKKITLPEESGRLSISTDYTVYDGYNGPYWNSDAEILVHHQELHKYATNNTDPHFIYYLVRHCRWFNSQDYKLYYGQLLFRNEILAYLRVYANYKEWPTIRSVCKRGITEYPCVWRDFSTIAEVLKMADEEGAEAAHKLYMQRYSDNYQKQIGNISDHKDRRKTYEYESTFRGWSSENIRGEARVYKVDSEDAVIGIRNVERILLVLRDGEDITELCGLTAENVMTIPLRAAETVELEYRIGVTPLWWKDYIARNTGRDFQGPPRCQ